MKRTISLFLCALAFASGQAFAEGNADKPAADRKVLVSPNLLGPLVGYYSATLELKVDRSVSAEIAPAFFNLGSIPLLGTIVDSSGVGFWYGACKLGVNYYGQETFKGPFVGAYAKGGVFTYSYDSDTTRAGYAGLGAKIGYRWTGSWASFALGASYEYNMAFASLGSVDSSTSLFTSAVDGGMPGAFMTFSFVL